MISDRDNASLRIEVSTDARDLFRASIDMAKLRLLLGLGISVALITGLICMRFAGNMFQACHRYSGECATRSTLRSRFGREHQSHLMERCS